MDERTEGRWGEWTCRCLRRGALGCIFALLLAGCASREPPPPTFTGFIQAQTAPVEPWSPYPGVTARRLSADEFTGRSAMQLSVPLGWRWSGMINDAYSREWYVLEGRLQAGERVLQGGDLLYVPPGASPPALTAIRPAKLLAFTEPADASSQLAQTFVASARALPWRPDTTAPDTGAPPDVSVKDLKSDPGNGARTRLVRIGPGVEMPWQSYSVVEEGYLLEGDYRLSECLPAGQQDGDYLPGGYFWRPAGLVHGGPASGTDGGAVWLMRSTGAPRVTVHDACEPPTP